jgi:subtilisin family serine protease/PKD repeat protein
MDLDRSHVLVLVLLFVGLPFVAAFPSIDMTGMFSESSFMGPGSDEPPISAEQQEFVDRMYGNGEAVSLSESNVEIQEKNNKTYAYPKGVNVSKFDEKIFDTGLMENELYSDLDAFSIIVEVEDPIESGSRDEIPEEIRSMESEGLVEVENILKASDSVALTVTSNPGEVFGRLNGVGSVERGILDSRVEALNLGANGVVGAGHTRQTYDINGSGEVLAVLDTGVNPSHLDFQGRIADQKDFSGDGTGDAQGHGTHVSGTVLGDGSADGGYYPGISQEASLMSVKVLGDFGFGSSSDIQAGIEYAADNNASVISMSLRGGNTETRLTNYNDSVQYARERGSVVVAAAGNDNYYGTIGAPGSVPDIITVGAVTDFENMASFSSKGPEDVYYTIKPEVTAPGNLINSASYEYPSTNYTGKSGTSMATPVVSGVIGLVSEENPGWSVQEVENAVIASGDGNRIGDGKNVFQRGTGVINASKAVDPELKISETRFNMGNISASQKYSRIIGLENPTGEQETYSISSEVHMYNRSAQTVQSGDQASITFNQSSVTIPAGESRDVEMYFEIDEEYSEPYGGFVRFNGDESYGALVGGYTNNASQLSADIGLNSSVIDIDGSVQADGSGSMDPDGSIQSYSWDMGDGTSLSGEVVEHSYSSLGNYSVQLTVEDSDTNQAIDTETVSVRDLQDPEAVFTVNDTSLEASIDAVEFDSSQSSDNLDISNYLWDFDGDGSYDLNTSDTVVENSYSTVGTRTVELNVLDTSGNSATTTMDIDVEDTTPPEASITANSTGLNIDEDVELDASSSSDNTGIATYNWRLNGTVIDSSETFVESFSTPGLKNIELEAEDDHGNSATENVNLNVTDETPPNPSIVVSHEPGIAREDNVTFNGEFSSDNVGIEEYRWDLGDNGTVDYTGKNFTKVFDSAGVYNVSLEVEDSSGNTNTTSEELEIVSLLTVDVRDEEGGIFFTDVRFSSEEETFEETVASPTNITLAKGINDEEYNITFDYFNQNITLIDPDVDQSSEHAGHILNVTAGRVMNTVIKDRIIHRGLSMNFTANSSAIYSSEIDEDLVYNSSNTFSSVCSDFNYSEESCDSNWTEESVSVENDTVKAEIYLDNASTTSALTESAGINASVTSSNISDNIVLEANREYGLEISRDGVNLSTVTGLTSEVYEKEGLNYSIGFGSTNFSDLQGGWSIHDDTWTIESENGENVLKPRQNVSRSVYTLDFDPQRSDPSIVQTEYRTGDASVTLASGLEYLTHSSEDEWVNDSIPVMGDNELRWGVTTFDESYSVRDIRVYDASNSYEYDGFRPRNVGEYNVSVLWDIPEGDIVENITFEAEPSPPEAYSSSSKKVLLDMSPSEATVLIDAPYISENKTSVSFEHANGTDILETFNQSITSEARDITTGENVPDGGCGYEEGTLECTEISAEVDPVSGNYTLKTNVSNEYNQSSILEREYDVLEGINFDPDIIRFEGSNQYYSYFQIDADNRTHSVDSTLGDGIGLIGPDYNETYSGYVVSQNDPEPNNSSYAIAREYNEMSLDSNLTELELDISRETVESGDLTIYTRGILPGLNATSDSVTFLMDDEGEEELGLYGCENMTVDGCDSTWEKIQDVQSNAGSFTFVKDIDDDYNGLAYAKEEEDDSDDGGDSGGSGGSGGSSGGSFGYVPDPELVVEESNNRIRIYNIYEGHSLEFNETGLPVRGLEFDSDADNGTVELESIEPDTELSFASSFRASSNISGPFTIQFEVSEAWLEENRFNASEISIYREEGETWVDQGAELLDSVEDRSIYEAKVDGFSDFGIGVDKACYSTENVTAETEDSCMTYSNPCQIPEEAEEVDSCQSFDEEKEVRQEIEDKKQEVEDRAKISKLSRAETLVEQGDISQAREIVDNISAEEGSDLPLMAIAGVLSVLVLAGGGIGAFIIVRKRRLQRMVIQMGELVDMMKDLQRQGRNVRTPAMKLQQANRALQNGNYSRAREKTEEVKKYLKQNL